MAYRLRYSNSRSVLYVLVLFLMNHDAHSTTYHVLPSSDRCPTHMQPCLTLSQFGSNTSSYLQSNTTLVFQSGSHSLDKNVSVKGIVSFHLLNFNTQNASIICDDSSLDLYNITSVHISRLKFIGCNGLRGESIYRLLIEDTTFLNDNSALELVRSTATIKRSYLISNRVGNLKRVSVMNLQRGGHPIVLAGGAIVLTRNSVVITGSSRTEQKLVGQYFVRETATSLLSTAPLNRIMHLATVWILIATEVLCTVRVAVLCRSTTATSPTIQPSRNNTDLGLLTMELHTLVEPLQW